MDADFAVYVGEVATARMGTVGRSLDETFVSTRGITMDLRWVYLHMIEEYPRTTGTPTFCANALKG